jgi:medium-chain acyl-[acyl-carrier-protein] hydrolase
MAHDAGMLWVRLVGRAQPYGRLFCFPYAGGGAGCFRAWASLFPPAIEVRGLRLPGRETRFSEPLIQDMATLVGILERTLEPYLDRPYAFLGNCAGAFVAYGLAQQIQEVGAKLPAHLFVLATEAPGARAGERRISSLPRTEFLRRVVAIGGMPVDTIEDEELLDILEPTLRADFRLIERWENVQRGVTISVPITVFHGSDDPHVLLGGTAAWRLLTNERFAVRLLSCDHFIVEAAGRDLMENVCAILNWRDG